MADKFDRRITPSPKGGVFWELATRLKLVYRLILDRRINPLLKILPIGSLVYMLAPDLAPGPIDDAAIIWLGAYLFVELCPQEIVEEHMTDLTKTIPGVIKSSDTDEVKNEDVVDAEYWEDPK